MADKPYTTANPSAYAALTPAAGQAPASNTAAVATLTPTSGKCILLSQVSWSYSGTPTGGSITIAWASTSQVFSVTGAGPGQLTFVPPMLFDVDEAVTITLAAGGGGITGKVYANAAETDA